MPLKNEFRVTEPAPGTQEVKRSGLVKERPSKCSCPRNYGENWRTTSLDSFDKIKEKKNRKEKGKLACGRLETPGGWLEKSISISCSRRLRRNVEIERFGRLPPFSGIPVASSATKISILGFLGLCSLWAKDGVRCKDVPVVFPKRRPRSSILQISLHRVATFLLVTKTIQLVPRAHRKWAPSPGGKVGFSDFAHSNSDRLGSRSLPAVPGPDPGAAWLALLRA